MKKLIVLSVFLVISILGIVFGYENLKMDEFFENNIDLDIPLLNSDQPVVSTVMTIGKPYEDKGVNIAVDFYDPTKENQEKSIIVIDKTYIPNKGVLYKNSTDFDVLAIYDGTVMEVSKDDLTGNYVRINHNNDLVATYKIIDDIQVKKGDTVKKGDRIGISSTSEIAAGHLLLLELQSKSVNVNPEEYYNKTIKEI